MIVIVDYGTGNLRSILNKFERIGVKATISDQIVDIEKAEKLILPGVGHFAKAMNNLVERRHIDVLNKKVLKGKTPILGICLGMQLFSKFSSEGNIEGFGWLDAETVRFDPDNMRRHKKVPHMGWNTIEKQIKNPILDGITEKDVFYFVHCYHMVCNDPSDVTAITEYGYKFVSAVCRENIYGTQFHPEKSHKKGLEILTKFAEI